MNALTIIQLIASLLPSIIQIVKAVEDAVGSGRGKEKLEMAKGILQAGYDGAVKFEQAWPSIEKAVAATVSCMNSIGQFKKG